jgi:putative AbiEii toxin of type IV toxin-antitoxin system/AAA domain-containing protein
VIRTLTIRGLRGFGTEQQIEFAEPTGEAGSGLTILVGPNSGGKSTIVEALRAMAGRREQSFAAGKRNVKAGENVLIRCVDTTGRVHELASIVGGGSEAAFNGNANLGRFYVVPSRSYFNPFFGKSFQSREDYVLNLGFPAVRGTPLDAFACRMFNVQGDANTRQRFNDLLRKIVDPLPEWTIDLADGGQYFLKFKAGTGSHSSDGLGEGLVSCFFIVDALYDSDANDIIVVDEPELSLHPTFQRRLAALINDYTRTQQVIIATHSPYFVDFKSVIAGARIARVYLRDGDSIISSLTSQSAKRVEPFLRNRNNPHILGLDAREVFFLSDGVILVEGQDDIASYPEIALQLGKSFSGDFFGWGAGGADNMGAIAGMLRDLGFKKVVALFDGNKRDAAARFGKEFPDYRAFVIPADDVRTKSARKQSAEVKGMLDEHGKIRPEQTKQMDEIIGEANNYLNR